MIRSSPTWACGACRVRDIDVALVDTGVAVPECERVGLGAWLEESDCRVRCRTASCWRTTWYRRLSRRTPWRNRIGLDAKQPLNRALGFVVRAEWLGVEPLGCAGERGEK